MSSFLTIELNTIRSEQNEATITNFIHQYSNHPHLVHSVLCNVLKVAELKGIQSFLPAIEDNLYRDVKLPASMQGINELKRYRLQELQYNVMNLDQTFGVADSVESCSVCMDEFKATHNMAEFPCGHLFHEQCIMSWLRTNHTCPVCRYQVWTCDPLYNEILKQKRGKKKRKLLCIETTSNANIFKPSAQNGDVMFYPLSPIHRNNEIKHDQNTNTMSNYFAELSSQN